MRKDKPCTGDKFGSESCPPGSKRYNLAKTFRKMAKEGMNEGKLGHLERASVLAASDDPKDQDKAREIKTRFDYESLKRQIGSKKKPSKPAVNETTMPNVSSNDKKAIKSRAKNLFKRDLKGEHDGVNESVGGGVPMTPQELEIQKKMSRLNVRLAKKRNAQMMKAKVKDTETSPEQVKEGSLHKWFKGSKSKDGKAGWVNVKTGGTCASDEPGEGTPKCVSSAKRASMTKAERDSASRRKKAADPNQQQKSGAAKPTYVRTDSKKKMKESKDVMDVAKELTKASKMHKGQAEKLKKHAKDMKETKNCGCGQDPCITYGKKEEVSEASGKAVGAVVKQLARIGAKKLKSKKVKKAIYKKGKEIVKKVGGAGLEGAVDAATDRARETGGNIVRDAGKKKEVKEACWKGYKARGMKKKGGKLVPNCKPIGEAKVDKGRSDYGKASIRNYRRMGPGHGEPAMFDPENKRGKLIDKRREEHKSRRGVKGAKVPAYKTEEVVAEADKKGKGSGTKDACYHKVKASAKVWPSAYASGRLVQCRKKGAANYGKSKSEEFEYETWTTDVILEKVAAWQRKEGKRESGGLNQKGVDSYRRENPGSKLKTAVTTEPSKLKKGSKSANRRKSFCARMSGMKKKLTSAKTANDPDSRINKSLRKWNCSYEPEGTPIMEKDAALDFVRKSIEKEAW